MPPPAATSGWRTGTTALRHWQFRWVLLSNASFFFAMNGQFVVRSYLAFKLTDSALALGLVNLAVSIPMLVISPFGGVIADRVEKKRLIMGGQLALLLNELVVLTLLMTGLLAFWHLLVVAFIMGCVFPFSMPARQAAVVNIVGRQDLANAMALNMGAMNTSRVVGPVTAGLVIALVGMRWMYLVAVIMYLTAFLTMSRIEKQPPAEGAGKNSVLGDLAEGFRYVRNDPPVRILLLLSMVPILLAMPFQALLVVFAEDVWHVSGGEGLGLLQAAAGLGGICGSVIVAWKGQTRRKLRLMMASLFAFGGSLFLFALSPWFLLALPLVFVSDVFASMFNTVNNTAIQMLIPDAVRGRVASLMMMTFGLTPLGTMPVSAFADAFGAPAAVATASAITVGASLLFFLFSPALRSIDAVSHAALQRVDLEALANGRRAADQVASAAS
jgi:MFS family permease